MHLYGAMQGLRCCYCVANVLLLCANTYHLYGAMQGLRCASDRQPLLLVCMCLCVFVCVRARVVCLCVYIHGYILNNRAELSAAECDKEAWRLLGELDLIGKRMQRASNMSGGQQRRLSLAVSLIGTPKVVLLDEPTTGAHSPKFSL